MKAKQILVVGLLAVVLLGGLWLSAGVLAPGYTSAFIYGFAWFILASVAIRFVVRARPDLKLPLRATYLTVVVLVVAGTAWTQLRDDKVNESVVMADALPAPPAVEKGRAPKEVVPAKPRNVLLAKGGFEGIEKDASGTAKLIDVANGRKGRKLTLTDFEVARGPDYYVYLAKGPATISSVPDYENLGRLKGNIGNQQYDVPSDLDPREYTHVVIWCRAFSAGIAQAPLRAT